MLHACMHTRINAYVHVCLYANIHIHMHIRMYMYTYMYVHRYAHIQFLTRNSTALLRLEPPGAAEHWSLERPKSFPACPREYVVGVSYVPGRFACHPHLFPNAPAALLKHLHAYTWTCFLFRIEMAKAGQVSVPLCLCFLEAWQCQ